MYGQCGICANLSRRQQEKQKEKCIHVYVKLQGALSAFQRNQDTKEKNKKKIQPYFFFYTPS